MGMVVCGDHGRGVLELAPVPAQSGGALELASSGAEIAADRAFRVGPEHCAIRLDPGDSRRCRVPLLRALEAARQTLSNDRLSLSVSDATAKVREGVDLAAALRVENVFPPVLIHLIASGEKTGALPPMLERAAQTLSRDIERRAMGMTALLEPLMIVVMGGVVLVIVMAVLLPIIEINQLVQ